MEVENSNLFTGSTEAILGRFSNTTAIMAVLTVGWIIADRAVAVIILCDRRPFLGRFLLALHLCPHRCAVAIPLRPAAEIVRLGITALCFARRAFCARLIFRRAETDIECRRDEPLARTLPKEASAASMRWASLRVRVLFSTALQQRTGFPFSVFPPRCRMIAGQAKRRHDSRWTQAAFVNGGLLSR
jgi:hypothetical protein